MGEHLYWAQQQHQQPQSQQQQQLSFPTQPPSAGLHAPSTRTTIHDAAAGTGRLQHQQPLQQPQHASSQPYGILSLPYEVMAAAAPYVSTTPTAVGAVSAGRPTDYYAGAQQPSVAVGLSQQQPLGAAYAASISSSHIPQYTSQSGYAAAGMHQQLAYVTQPTPAGTPPSPQQHPQQYSHEQQYPQQPYQQQPQSYQPQQQQPHDQQQKVYQQQLQQPLQPYQQLPQLPYQQYEQPQMPYQPQKPYQQQPQPTGSGGGGSHQRSHHDQQRPQMQQYPTRSPWPHPNGNGVNEDVRGYHIRPQQRQSTRAQWEPHGRSVATATVPAHGVPPSSDWVTAGQYPQHRSGHPHRPFNTGNNQQVPAGEGHWTGGYDEHQRHTPAIIGHVRKRPPSPPHERNASMMGGDGRPVGKRPRIPRRSLPPPQGGRGHVAGGPNWNVPISDFGPGRHGPLVGGYHQTGHHAQQRGAARGNQDRFGEPKRVGGNGYDDKRQRLPDRRQERQLRVGGRKGRTVKPVQLFVRNIPTDMDERALRKAFNVSGEVTNVVILRFKGTQKSRGVATVSMARAADGANAIQRFHGTEMAPGLVIAVCQMQPNQKVPRGLEKHFPTMRRDMRNRMKLDEVAEYSVSDQRAADWVARVFHVFGISSSASVLDGTACVGGNTMAFVNHFQSVYAVESDPSRFSLLRHNVKNACHMVVTEVDGVSIDSAEKVGTDGLCAKSPGSEQKGGEEQNGELSDNDEGSNDMPATSVRGRTRSCDVHLYCNDLVQKLGDIQHDALFLDPPWGGPLYKVEENLTLELSGVSLHQLCFDAAEKCGTRLALLKLPNNFDFDGFAAGLLACFSHGVAAATQMARVCVPEMTYLLCWIGDGSDIGALMTSDLWHWHLSAIPPVPLLPSVTRMWSDGEWKLLSEITPGS